MTPDTGTFTLKRGENSFGPYTAAEVAAYLAAGNIAADDAIFDHDAQVWITAAALVARFEGNTAVATPIAHERAATGELASGAPPIHRGPPLVATGTDKSGQAIAALVLGLLSVTGCGLVTGIIAIILGNGAKDDPKHGTLARAGLITGIIGTALSVLGTCGWLAFFVFA